MAQFITSTNLSSIPSTTALSSSTTTCSLTALQFDKFFQSCSIIALSKKYRNIGIVSCQYSSNVYINRISDFIYLIKPNPSLIIVPLFHSGRISLAVFFVADKKLGYYDSMKQPPVYSLPFAKTAIERYLKCPFTLIIQEAINSTINNNPVPELANYHICRIAEEICFTGVNQKLLPFDVILESQRIKKIISLVTDKAWKGEWIASLNSNSSNQRVDLINQNPGGSGDSDTVRDDIAALASVVAAFGDGGNVVSQSSSITTATRRSKEKDRNVGEKIIHVINKMSIITSTSMTDFNVKYPVIAKMLYCYLNFTKRRNDLYSRSEKACTMQKVFNWKIFTQMDHKSMEEFLIVLADLPFFSELSETDKMALFKRFWVPFSLLERIYDTVNTLDSNGLLKATNPAVLEKATFESWNLLLPLMKKIEPHCLEVMYIFCCLIWNTSFLEAPLSVEGEEVVRRGRLIIHREMREFYNYDEIQWERIYALRHVLLTTEKCVGDLNIA